MGGLHPPHIEAGGTTGVAHHKVKRNMPKAAAPDGTSLAQHPISTPVGGLSAKKEGCNVEAGLEAGAQANVQTKAQANVQVNNNGM